MKKILLIGKFNDALKELHDYLSKRFMIQLCSDDVAVADGMLKIMQPDLVLISLIGLYSANRVTFGLIKSHYPQLPVITIGTESECRDFAEYYGEGQFKNITRPIDVQVVFVAICERLSLDPAQVEVQEETGKPRVLIVDDNAATLRSIKGLLDERYEITVATSGMKAMTSMGKHRPDVILLDYEMPVCDGKQTLEMIRADEELASIPVIFLTGVSDREHIQAVLGLHPAGYLLKPPVQQTLIETIDKALESLAG